MKILFVHQNFPGQFLHLAPALARLGHECLVLTDERNSRPQSLPTWRYRFAGSQPDPEATRLGRSYTAASDRGTVVARAAAALRARHGLVPDLIIGHSGWGETLYLKEVWPEAKLLVYAEFYYQGRGADVGFDPEISQDGLSAQLSARARSAHLGQSLLAADHALVPTRWQASTHPPLLRQTMDVIFDGVDTDLHRPDPGASLVLPDGLRISAGDEVLTFACRNLEPYRGFHIFMRALPAVLRARPSAQVVIAGGDEVSYGAPPPGGGSWKERLLAELGAFAGRERVHFTGFLPHDDLRRLMQITRAHAYLTYPFVLSWSMVEAMAAGALVIGSDTPPVAEMISHGETGLLVDFFDVAAWSAQLTDALANPDRYAPLRQAARSKIAAQYDLQRHCLPAQLALVERLLSGGAPPWQFGSA